MREHDVQFDSVRSPSVQRLRMAFDADNQVIGMDHDAAAAIVARNVVGQQEVVRRRDDVEAVAVILVRQIVGVDAIDDVVGHEAIETIVMGDAVGDGQAFGPLVRIEAVTGMVVCFDAKDPGILIGDGATGNATRVVAVDLAGGVLAVAVERQIFDENVRRVLAGQQGKQRRARRLACQPQVLAQTIVQLETVT